MENTIVQFSDEDRQTLDPDGMLKKFYEQHVRDGKVEVPDEMKPKECLSYGYYSAEYLKRLGVRELDRDVACRFDGLVHDLVTVSLLLGDVEGRRRIFGLARSTFHLVAISSKRRLDPDFERLGCCCDHVASAQWTAAHFGLEDEAANCKFVVCPSYGMQSCQAADNQPRLLPPDEARAEIVQHLGWLREKLAKQAQKT